MTESSALLTDRYELTMVDAALRENMHERECVFEVFTRRLPAGRRYGVLAGTGRLLELIQKFRFGPSELEYVREAGIVHPDTLEWLANFRFSGSITGYHEGELFFPGSPVLTVEAPFAEGVVLETLVLSVLNYDSAVASAAARMVTAAAGRPLVEMGSRRTGEHSAVAAARAAHIVGFGATSNLEAGRTWGIPTMGTAAHAFTLLHQNEEEAFRAQVAALGVGTTLLVDTYDVATGIDTAIRVAGTNLGAVRLDSGDLPTLVRRTREQLDALGATNTRITVTNDLDEFTIAALSGAPVDSYGVGTSVVTGSGSPACGMVYKLVSHRDSDGPWIPVAKKSDGKASIGGRKRALRRRDERGNAVAEMILVDQRGMTSPEYDRPLLVSLVTDGIVRREHTGAIGVRNARDHHAVIRHELPEDALRLGPGGPAIPTIIV